MSGHKIVALRKVNATVGSLPEGHVYEWTYKSATREAAVQRAWRGLKRDHPTENPMCWELVPAERFYINEAA